MNESSSIALAVALDENSKAWGSRKGDEVRGELEIQEISFLARDFMDGASSIEVAVLVRGIGDGQPMQHQDHVEFLQ